MFNSTFSTLTKSAKSFGFGFKGRDITKGFAKCLFKGPFLLIPTNLSLTVIAHLLKHRMKQKTIEKRCNFKTDRLSVCGWASLYADKESKNNFDKKVISILTPKVTKSLPDGWQNIKTVTDAQSWIRDRAEESHFVTVQLKPTNEIVGFIFFYESDFQESSYKLRFGYLLSDSVWGKGLGVELIKGLINWCKAEGNIISISGGVETDNVGSIKVLEKTGFSPSTIANRTEDTVFYEYLFNTEQSDNSD